jgi:hypothetical protein
VLQHLCRARLLGIDGAQHDLLGGRKCSDGWRGNEKREGSDRGEKS